VVDLSQSSICAFYLSPVALFDEGQEGWQAEKDLDGCLPANDQYTSAEVYNYGAVLDTGDKAIGTLRVNFTEAPVDIGKSISSLIPSIGADDIAEGIRTRSRTYLVQLHHCQLVRMAGLAAHEGPGAFREKSIERFKTRFSWQIRMPNSPLKIKTILR
jgi:hypothetical protein